MGIVGGKYSFLLFDDHWVASLYYIISLMFVSFICLLVTVESMSLLLCCSVCLVNRSKKESLFNDKKKSCVRKHFVSSRKQKLEVPQHGLCVLTGGSHTWGHSSGWEDILWKNILTRCLEVWQLLFNLQWSKYVYYRLRVPAFSGFPDLSSVQCKFELHFSLF